MRIVVTGAGGQLATALSRLLGPAGLGPAGPAWQALSEAEFDITDAARVRAVVRDQARAAAGDLIVVNAAAWTDVDRAESREQAAYAVNATGPANLAAACAGVGATLVHVSTDYVFGGEGRVPYGADDTTGPRSAYGRTKLAGEQAVRALLPESSYVVRTAWLYGATGQNFVKTMARLEGERETVDVVDDQEGSPTWSVDLARAVLDLVGERPRPGVYHAVNSGSTTWYGLARAVFEELEADPARVRPATTAACPRPAHRPGYSVLSVRGWLAAGLPALRPWREALHRAMADMRSSVPAPVLNGPA